MSTTAQSSDFNIPDVSIEHARQRNWRFRIDNTFPAFIEFDQCTFECECLKERKSYLTPNSNIHVNCLEDSNGQTNFVCSLYASPEHRRSEIPNVFGSHHELINEVFDLGPDATNRCEVKRGGAVSDCRRFAFDNCQIVTWNQGGLYYARQRQKRCEFFIECANGLHGRIEQSLRMFTDIVHNCKVDYDLLAYYYNVCRLMPAVRNHSICDIRHKKECLVISDLCNTMAKLQLYTTPNALRLKQRLRSAISLDEINDTMACPSVEAPLAVLNAEETEGVIEYGGIAYTDWNGVGKALNAGVWKCLYALLRVHERCPTLFEMSLTEFECPHLKSTVLSLRCLLSPEDEERKYWCLWNALLCPERLKKHFQIDCHG